MLHRTLFALFGVLVRTLGCLLEPLEFDGFGNRWGAQNRKVLMSVLKITSITS